MMQTLAVTLLFLSTAGSALAQSTPSKCGPLDREVEAQDIECLVNELVDQSFPDLAAAKSDGRITIRKIRSEDTFVKSAFVSGFIHGSESRIYAIDVNPSVYRTFLPVLPRPSIKAMRGILAHELIHLVDYENASAIGLAKILKENLTDKEGLERSIDERAFELGYAEGIELFRLWASTRVPATEASAKKSHGYTPDEIHEWIMTNELARPVH